MKKNKFLIKSYKQMFMVIGIFTLILLVGGTTYAFFNYTRTGSSNTVKTGTINFTSSQAGTFNLTNVFPIATGDVLSDNNNSSEVVITVSGDTTYSQGIEYLVTLEDVNIRTNTYKKVPVGLMVTPEKTGELGTSDNAYFTNRGGETSIYKSFIGQSDILEDGQYVLVGYIRPGEAEVNGTIGIRAFIDKDSIAITDTPEENTEWQNGRMVLSTSEWNSLQTNGISFKVRVQANEGVWVGEPTSRNDLENFYSTQTFTNEQKSGITEINFIRMSEEMIDTHTNAVDLTEENGQGVVKGWIDGTKLYIASPGVTYFPVNSSSLLENFSNVTSIKFNNINTSEVELMRYAFAKCNSLPIIDLTSFDTSNVTDMNSMFWQCTSLTDFDLSSIDTSSVTDMSFILSGCTNLIKVNLSGLGSNTLNSFVTPFSGSTNLREINMSNFNFGTSTMRQTFDRLANLEKINLTNANTSGVTDMEDLFYYCSSIKKIDLSNLGGNDLSIVTDMFDYCDNLEEIKMSNFNFGTASVYSLFSSLPKLQSVDLSSANLSHVKNMSYAFYNSRMLSNVNLNNIDTSGVEDMSNLFEYCTSLSSIDISSLDMNSLKKMSYMFKNCSGLTSIDLSGLGGNNLNTIQQPFIGTSNLKEINMSSFNFGQTTDLTYLFQGLSNLEIVDLANVNISNVTDMSIMFAQDTSLKTIYVSNNWDVSNVTYASGMFRDCSSLVGGNGTVFDSNHEDKDYAIIDGAPSNPGYLTLKTN